MAPVPSPEIEAVMRRIIAGHQARDLDTLENLFSQDATFRAIGTAPDEFWDAESIIPVMRAQMQEMPPFEIVDERVEAFESGEIGWGTAVVHVEWQEGTDHETRFSMVFKIENGVWRCVLHHSAVPVPDEELIGVTLTKTLDDLLESLGDSALASLRRDEGTATLMFTDIEDSTVLAQEMGDHRWGEVIDDHDEFVEVTVGKHGGSVLKTLGDGALIAFTGARAALRCATDLQEGFASRPFEVRIGIHAGDVVHKGDDVIGVTVNKAARVAAAAGGGQVVMSATVRDLVGSSGEFTFGDPFLVELKGIEGVHELVPLVVDAPDRADRPA